jgi:hypothetical protein
MTFKKFLYVMLIPLTAIIIYINHKLDASARMPTPVTVSGQPLFSAPPKKIVNKQSAADAGHYGIEVDNKDDAAKTQDQWTDQMSQTLDQSGLIDSMNQQGLLEGLRNDPQKMKEKLQRIDDEIREQEVKTRQFPDNPDEKSRLQSLYMLKATLTALDKKAVPAKSADQK